MNKVFGISFLSSKAQPRSSLESQKQATATATASATKSSSATKIPMADIQQHMTQCLHDVTSLEADRLRYNIRAARNVNDLWLLRSGLYQTISKQHSQSEAVLRINALLPYFKRWIPERQLSRV